MAARGPAGLPAKVVTVPPNQTLYVANLPTSKTQKNDLRTALYMLFSTYGPVLDVVALKTNPMRGQAHIVYRDIQTATQAMRALDGAEFLGRKIKIQYAKGRSNIIAKLDGTFKFQSASSGAVEMTDLQQSIFNRPVPGTTSADESCAANGVATGHNLPPRPQASAGLDYTMKDAGSSASRGTKRLREEEEQDKEESDSDVAMEEDSDDED